MKGLLKKVKTLEKVARFKTIWPVLIVQSEAEIENHRNQIGPDTVILIDDVPERDEAECF